MSVVDIVNSLQTWGYGLPDLARFPTSKFYRFDIDENLNSRDYEVIYEDGIPVSIGEVQWEIMEILDEYLAIRELVNGERFKWN